MAQPKTARYLIIEALSAYGPLTSAELAEKIPALTLKQIKDNVTAAKAPGYIKSQMDVTQGSPVHQLTPGGVGWWKANKAMMEKSTASSTATTDKPGVSAKTPEASVHGSHPLPAVADARPENAPVEVASTADTGGDGTESPAFHIDNIAIDAFARSMKNKMEVARISGRSGWHDKAQVNDYRLAYDLLKHLAKGLEGDLVDIGNYAMMLEWRKANPTELKKAFFDFMAEVDPAVSFPVILENFETDQSAWDASAAKEMIDCMGKSLDAIGHMAAPYMKEGELIQNGVATMEMLIEADGAYIELLDSIIKAQNSQISQLKALVETYSRNPVKGGESTYIIAAGWRIAEGLEEANEAAIRMAFDSAGGKVVIARPVQLAEVSVQLKEFPQCAAATAPLSN